MKARQRLGAAKVIVLFAIGSAFVSCSKVRTGEDLVGSASNLTDVTLVVPSIDTYKEKFGSKCEQLSFTEETKKKYSATDNCGVIAALLSEYTLQIKESSSGCDAGVVSAAVDTKGSFTASLIRQQLVKGCDYDVALRVGRSDGAFKAYFDNAASAVGAIKRAELTASRVTVRVTLTPTSEGVSVGFRKEERLRNERDKPLVDPIETGGDALAGETQSTQPQPQTRDPYLPSQYPQSGPGYVPPSYVPPGSTPGYVPGSRPRDPYRPGVGSSAQSAVEVGLEVDISVPGGDGAVDEPPKPSEPALPQRQQSETESALQLSGKYKSPCTPVGSDQSQFELITLQFEENAVVGKRLIYTDKDCKDGSTIVLVIEGIGTYSTRASNQVFEVDLAIRELNFTITTEKGVATYNERGACGLKDWKLMTRRNVLAEGAKAPACSIDFVGALRPFDIIKLEEKTLFVGAKDAKASGAAVDRRPSKLGRQLKYSYY